MTKPGYTALDDPFRRVEQASREYAERQIRQVAERRRALGLPPEDVKAFLAALRRKHAGQEPHTL